MVRTNSQYSFDYTVEAGQILQPPTPLNLLGPPMAPRVAGVAPTSLNQEVWSQGVVPNFTFDSSGSGSITTSNTPVFKPFFPLVLSGLLSGKVVSEYLFPTNVDFDTNKLSGFVSKYLPSPVYSNNFGGNASFAFQIAIDTKGNPVTIVDGATGTIWDATVSDWSNGQAILSFANGSEPESGSTTLEAVILDSGFSSTSASQWLASAAPLPSDFSTTGSGGFTFKDRKGNLWVFRGPHYDGDTSANSQMQFYYNTLPGFYYPSLPPNQQPPVGTVTPYLRPISSQGGYVGDPVNGNSQNHQVPDGNALAIHYSGVWPSEAPVLQMAQTLTTPNRGLPAIRGQSSLQILYQQSLHSQVGGANDQPSVVLHDPTRAKTFLLSTNPVDPHILGAIPKSVKTEVYQGKTYFPVLPPHLVKRFFFDPNVGPAGALVFDGQFVNPPVGDSYLLLNVLSSSDKSYLSDTNIINQHDPLFGQWTSAIDNLKTVLQTFGEDPTQAGSYIPNPDKSVAKFSSDLADIESQNIPVDSYALTAVGPGSGYVTLVAGNGLNPAQTPAGDPVSLLVLRVDPGLYRGQLDIVDSDNPLSEKAVVQQVVDLAGHADQYQFDWRIAAPVDGKAPQVYNNHPTNLFGATGAAWMQLLFPLSSDTPAGVFQSPGNRTNSLNTLAYDPYNPSFVTNIQAMGLSSAATVIPDGGNLVLSDANLVTQALFQSLVVGNRVTLLDGLGGQVTGSVLVLNRTDGSITVAVDNPSAIPANFRPKQLAEATTPLQPQTVLFTTFAVPSTAQYSELWLSLDFQSSLGCKVFLDGQLAVTANTGTNDSTEATLPSEILQLNSPPLPHSYLVAPEMLAGGTPNPDNNMVSHQLTVFLYSGAPPLVPQRFNLKLDAGQVEDLALIEGSQWLPVSSNYFPDGIRVILGQTADVRALSDNYLIMRYASKNQPEKWSQWTDPTLVEGWIKRVLAGINPFNQRVTDFFNNAVNTDVSLLTQAGPRWEGDVALNSATLNDYGLIQIYETVLNRGKGLSIGAGIDYGPANDALLLAAGYISDLYTFLGDTAWADANNPTIGITTSDPAYGKVATSLFPFQGQMATLLDQQLAMLRGRDDFSAPGVEIAPAYNRLYWNYTRGIASGEVIYALNYNIQPNPDAPVTGRISASDAQHMFPQGHGDAYGHYLTALTGYYGLLMNPNFTWVPQTEAVNILGVPVAVGYVHERKFAAAAGAVARAGSLIYDLTRRSEYVPGSTGKWQSLATNRVNSNETDGQSPRTRYWGSDYWAARTGQGALIHWVVGNALLPAVDPDPTHEGIQKIDRTTVPELQELPATYVAVQNSEDAAEGGLNPLGMVEGSLAFDINPNEVTGTEPKTHFEQIYERAVSTLNNAVASFDDATEFTQLMRSQENTIADYQAQINTQEAAYTNALVEIYGTPYTDDIGPGTPNPQGYNGPDLVHYMYTDLPESIFYPAEDSIVGTDFKIDIQNPTVPFGNTNWPSDNIPSLNPDGSTNSSYTTRYYIPYSIGPHGTFDKPASWTGHRATPGKLQQAASDIVKAQDGLWQELSNAQGDKQALDVAVATFNSQVATMQNVLGINQQITELNKNINNATTAFNIIDKTFQTAETVIEDVFNLINASVPVITVVGTSVGGDFQKPVLGAVDIAPVVAKETLISLDTAGFIIEQGLLNQWSNEILDKQQSIEAIQWTETQKEAIQQLVQASGNVQSHLLNLNTKVQAVDDAQKAYQVLLAKGDQIQAERQTWRQRVADVIQGYRTQDVAYRLFRNERLERYKTLFDLAARYALLAANAYDYETGLLDTDQGRSFVNKIVSSRALGVVENGQPQFGGSDLGDPGLSSALAEMKADWDVLKGRIGFNNPDAYGTTVSLRQEYYRILPGQDGDGKWSDILQRARMDNILEDQDVARNCLNIDPGDGSPVPGIVINFPTAISKGFNLFGQPLAGGDHDITATAYATKIFAVGVALDGYIGMDAPDGTAGSSTDPDALAATPDVYLIPVGTDFMRTPPLGDTQEVRSWNVQDVAIPIPFNIGGSSLSTQPLWQAADSLTEPLFTVRKHQAFRPVPSPQYFNNLVYGSGNSLQRSQYTNARLIGRSVWNSGWKIVIPGNTLLSDPQAGLDTFIRKVKDVQLYFQTYSYSGN